MFQTHVKRCLCCPRRAETHHIRTRGAGGSDEWWNTVRLCRIHHALSHHRGMHALATEYPRLMMALTERGWEFHPMGTNANGDPVLWKLRRA